MYAGIKKTGETLRDSFIKYTYEFSLHLKKKKMFSSKFLLPNYLELYRSTQWFI